MLHLRPTLQVILHPNQVDVVVLQGDVDFVQQGQVIAVVFQHGGGHIPGHTGRFHILVTGLGFPGIALAHHVVVKVRQVPEEGFLASAERALAKLENTYFYSVAESTCH